MHAPRRLAVSLLFLAGLLLPAAGAAQTVSRSASGYPLFYVGGYAHDLDQRDDLYFDLVDLTQAGAAARIVIQTPPGYRVTPLHPADYNLGEADVYTSKGTYHGVLDVAPRQAFKHDPSVAGCAEGAHAATWWMSLKGPKGELVAPVAVDRRSGGLRLEVCLGALNALGLKADEVYLQTSSVFRNPARPGTYRFSARVTPLGADGRPATASEYELRADEPLPEDVTLTSAQFDRETHRLTVSGTVVADGRPRVGVNVHVYVGQTSNVDDMTQVGIAVSNAGGAYTLARRILIPPVYVLAYVHHYEFDHCASRSSAPAGCKSESTDGDESAAVGVTTLRRA